MNMTDTKEKIASFQVSLKAFLSLVLTMIVILVSYWDQLPQSFRYVTIFLIVVEVIALFTGVKKLDPKEVLNMTLEAIATAKANSGGKDTTLLDGVESGITMLVTIWDKINTLFKPNASTTKTTPVTTTTTEAPKA
jgi:hypothetical protein